MYCLKYNEIAFLFFFYQTLCHKQVERFILVVIGFCLSSNFSLLLMGFSKLEEEI